MAEQMSPTAGPYAAPLFSVIIRSYNYAHVIGEAIESVLDQTLSSWELVIVDDASTDDSWEVLQQYSGHPRISLERNTANLGGAATYNVALARCTGEYIAALDCDDRWLPEFLERQHQAFQEGGDVEVVAAFVKGIDGAGRPLEDDGRARWFNRPRDLNDPTTWIWTNPVCHSAAVIRRDRHSQVGGLREDFVTAGDWDLWIRCLASGSRMAQLQQVLVESRVAEQGVTHGAPERLTVEYAEICGATLLPLLLARQERLEAVTAVRKFFAWSGFVSGSEATADAVFKELAAGGLDLVAEAAQAFAREQQERVHRLEASVEQHSDAVEVLREESRARAAEAHDSAATAAALQADLDRVQHRLRRIESSVAYRAYAKARRMLKPPPRQAGRDA